MTEDEWEELEVDMLETLNSVGILGEVEEAENLTFKYIKALRRLYREAKNEPDDIDD